MQEHKFEIAVEPEQSDDCGITTVMCTSHDQKEIGLDIEAASKALRIFCEANEIGVPEIMFVPCDFYFDENGAANFRGPDGDHPYFDEDRFKRAMDVFRDQTASERGMETPDEAWINVGGTYCCGPSWEKNPYYTGIETPEPGSAVH